MAHVWYHCGTVSKRRKLGKIPITIHDGDRLNFAAALKRRKGQSDESWAMDGRDFDRMVYEFYKRFQGRGEKSFKHKPSYIHEEP